MGKDLRTSVKDSTVKNKTFKATMNDPALRGKLRMDVDEPTDGVIYWYIKFNIALEPESVSKETMNIMETNGYILDAIISYDSERNVIVICPIDTYAEDIFYILTITKQVRSAKGVNMKKEVHILFKILNNRISEFQIMKDTVTVPKPKKKPKQIKTQTKTATETNAKYYTFMKDGKQPQGERLPTVYPKINLWLGIAGFLMMILAVFVLSDNFYFLMAAFVTVGVGVLHIIIQLCLKKNRSIISYIFGSGSFHNGDYAKARMRFERALALDGHNEYAEYALNKLAYYEKD
jgi:hypothetical protein